MPTSALISGQTPADRADVGIGPYELLNNNLITYYLFLSNMPFCLLANRSGL